MIPDRWNEDKNNNKSYKYNKPSNYPNHHDFTFITHNDSLDWKEYGVDHEIKTVVPISEIIIRDEYYMDHTGRQVRKE